MCDSTVRVKRWGKSPPPRAQATGHGKPHREQGQIGACGAARSRAASVAPGSGTGCLDKWFSPACNGRKTEFGLQPFQNQFLPPSPGGRQMSRGAGERRILHANPRFLHSCRKGGLSIVDGELHHAYHETPQVLRAFPFCASVGSHQRSTARLRSCPDAQARRQLALSSRSGG